MKEIKLDIEECWLKDLYLYFLADESPRKSNIVVYYDHIYTGK